MVTSFGSIRWAACLCALLSLTLAQNTIAADVDVSLRPPASVGADKLKARLGALRDRAKNTDTLELMRDPAYIAEFSDATWQLGRLIDNRQSVAGLEEFGLTLHPDGSVEVDIKNFPQWAPLSDLLKVLATPEDVDFFSAALRDRGLEDEDFEALRTYVAENDRRLLMRKASLPLIEHYAGIVRSGRGATLDDAMAHSYRLKRAWDEANRVWTNGLTERLRPQAVRIIESTLRELHGGRTIGPENVEEALLQEMSFIQSDGYPAQIETMKKELAR